MIPKLRMSDWHNEVRERGERETARLDELWAEGDERVDGGEAEIVAAAFALLGEPDRDQVRRALLDGLRGAADRARSGDGGAELERVLAAIEELAD